MTTKAHAHYIHALGPASLTRFYDPVVRRLMREDAFRDQLVEHAHLAPGQRFLDVGCGTGTLAVLVKQRHPGVEVHAVDGDPEVLGLARDKAERAGADVRFERAMAWELPYADGTFDRVASSLVFHHLVTDDKRRAAREIFRVLRPGGELLIADVGPPRTAPSRAIAWAFRGFEQVADNVAGRLPPMLSDAGFVDVAEVGRHRLLLGSIAYLQGRKPAG